MKKLFRYFGFYSAIELLAYAKAYEERKQVESNGILTVGQQTGNPEKMKAAFEQSIEKGYMGCGALEFTKEFILRK